MEIEEGGKINLIVGPMFSGKSTKLMKHINICRLQKRSTIIVKFDKDKRYSNENKLVTHDR
jgi:thymidine kinase